MKAFNGGLITATVLTLAGCANMHLYDKRDDLTATAASADYDAAKVADALKGQRSVLAALEQREVDAFHQVTLAQRDLELLSLIENDDRRGAAGTVRAGFIYRFNSLVDKRLADLHGGSIVLSPSQVKMQTARFGIDAAEAHYRELQNQVTKFVIVEPLKLPDCSQQVAGLEDDIDGRKTAALVSADDALSTKIRAYWNTGVNSVVQNAAKSCANLLRVRSEIGSYKPAAGSLLDRAANDYQSISESIDRQNTAAKQQKAALVAAATALADANQKFEAAGELNNYSCLAASASKSAKAPAAPTDGEPSTPAQKICGILDVLAKLGDAGVKELAEAKLAKIRSILAALNGAAPADTDGEVNGSLALISAATRLGRALDQYQKASTLPALEPLIIEKQLAEVQLAYATAGLKVQAGRLVNAKAKVDAIVLEIALLNEAKTEMAYFGAIPPAATSCRKDSIFCDTLEAILLKNPRTSNKTPVYRTVYRGIQLFGESFSVARDRQMEADVRLAGADYQDALIRSEAAVASWRAIVDTPVAQIRDYHAGGLKPETLAALLQAFGVIGIAVK